MGVHEVELSLMFAWSQMANVDELKDREAYTTMSFVDFLEALGRLADVKDLPTKVSARAFVAHHVIDARRKGGDSGSIRTWRSENRSAPVT